MEGRVHHASGNAVGHLRMQCDRALPARELHAVASITVRLRDECAPFQLLNFGMTGMPSRSLIEVLPPAS